MTDQALVMSTLFYTVLFPRQCTARNIDVMKKRGQWESVGMSNDGSFFSRFCELSISVFSFTSIKSLPFTCSDSDAFARFLGDAPVRRAGGCLVLNCRSFYGACSPPESLTNSRMHPWDCKAAGLASHLHFSAEANDGAICSSIFASDFRYLEGNSIDGGSQSRTWYNWERAVGDARVATWWRVIPKRCSCEIKCVQSNRVGVIVVVVFDALRRERNGSTWSPTDSGGEIVRFPGVRLRPARASNRLIVDAAVTRDSISFNAHSLLRLPLWASVLPLPSVQAAIES